MVCVSRPGKSPGHRGCRLRGAITALKLSHVLPPRPPRRGFTLLELCIVLALAVLLIAVAMPSLAGQMSRQRLQNTFDRFDSLAGEARKHSVTDGKPYVLVWRKGGVYLYPADLSVEDRRKNGALAYADFSDPSEGECALVRESSLTAKPAPEWTFWPTGNCEPVLVRYHGAAGSWEAAYNGLSAQGDLQHVSRPMSAHRHSALRGGFLLLEIMLAVAIFTLGVLALGRCLTTCLEAQGIRAQEERSRLALENAMVEIQASPVLPDENRRAKLEGMFTGITLVERRRTMDVKNEQGVAMNDLNEITLTAQWLSGDGQTHSRSIAFDLLRGRG